MQVTKTAIEGLVVIEPKVFEDPRGYFMESYKESFFEENFPHIEFVQDNESKSTRGVLRGLHFQKGGSAQTKLVRVIDGEVLDVAVDLRKDSTTYGQYESVILSAENKKQFLVPQGFAHGFIVLSDTAIFSYKVDNYYDPTADAGLLWSDPALGIDWMITKDEILLSDKDQLLPLLKDTEPQ